MFRISLLTNLLQTTNTHKKLLCFSFFFSLIYCISFSVYFYNSSIYKTHYVLLQPNYYLQSPDAVFFGKIYMLNWTGSHNEVVYQLFQDNINRLRSKINQRIQIRFDRNVAVFFNKSPTTFDLVSLRVAIEQVHKEQLEALLLAAKNYLRQVTNELTYVFIGDLSLPPHDHMWLLRNRHLIPSFLLEDYLKDKMLLVSNGDFLTNFNYQTIVVKDNQRLPYQAQPTFIKILLSSIIAGFATSLVFYFISIYLNIDKVS